MQKYADVVLDLEGNVVSGADVLILASDNQTTAALYDENGALTANPMKTGNLGDFSFFAPNGKYYVQISVNGQVLRNIGPVILFDPADDGPDSIAYTPPGPDGMLSTLKDSLDRVIKPRLNGNVLRKIVIAGSSTATGYGAPDNNGWAQQLAATMTARGWTVVNRSVGGDTTQKLLDRFHVDVALQSPDVCIIAMVLGNEGLYQAATVDEKVVVYENYLSNMRKLVWLCRQNGIIPVFADMLPHDAYSATDQKILRNAHRWLDQRDVMSLSWLDMMESDTGDGHYRGVFQNDGAHTNAAGHSAMYWAVAPSIFECLLDWNDRPQVPRRRAGWRTTGNPGDRPLFARFADPMRSFTVAFRCATRTTDKAIWGVNNSANNDATRISTAGAGGTFKCDVGGPLIATTVPVDGREHQHAVVYEHDQQRVSYYIDGSLMGTVSYQQTDTVQWMSFMDRGGSTATAAVGTIGDVMVYRTALNAASIKAIYDGDVQKGGMDLYCPLGDPDTALYSRAANYAPTASRLHVNTSGVVIDTTFGAASRLQTMRFVTESGNDPTANDIASKTWVVWKNTTSGTVKLWVNDGGTMKSVLLS